jgi:hypothetical protein
VSDSPARSAGDPLVTCVTGLDDVERAFREAATGLKAVFAIS